MNEVTPTMVPHVRKATKIYSEIVDAIERHPHIKKIILPQHEYVALCRADQTASMFDACLDAEFTPRRVHLTIHQRPVFWRTKHHAPAAAVQRWSATQRWTVEPFRD